MIFRDTSGKLVEVSKYKFTNDELYYKKIKSLKTQKYNAYEKIQQTTDNKIIKI